MATILDDSIGHVVIPCLMHGSLFDTHFVSGDPHGHTVLREHSLIHLLETYRVCIERLFDRCDSLEKRLKDVEHQANLDERF
jgi:hypothetical protein